MPPELRPADIFLTRGTGWISRAIRFFSRRIGEQRTSANHVGVVVTGGSLEKAVVVEALSKVRKHPLGERYLKSGDEVAVYRPISLTEDECARVVSKALTYVGRPYGTFQLVGHLLDWALQGAYVFRRLTASDRYPICSWVVAHAYLVGAHRFAELIEYQDRTVPLGGDPLLQVQLPNFVSGLRAADLWFGLHVFALSYDNQDPHNHSRFLYREPVEVDGTTQKASVLLVEGIDDSFTSNNTTRSLAWQLGGIPQLSPAPVVVSDLPQAVGPIQGNVDATTTAAMVQYVPNGSGPPPSPGCEFQFEGHFCAQTNPTARQQRVDFYLSALGGAVPIIE